jgi:hypothetical protein
VMAHLLSLLPYQQPELASIELPPLQHREYQRPPKETQRFVPAQYKMH